MRRDPAPSIVGTARTGRRALRNAAVVPAIALARVAHAQQAGSPTLPTVEVTVTRDAARPALDLPFAITQTRPDSTRPGQRHVGFEETLRLVPGLLAVTRTNPSQDPRISIRGFGARSAFGVRGIRIVRDGIPLTLPDGQTPTDYLDIENVGQVEVMRGSASALYGNAAGGVIDLHSVAPPPVPISATARASAGSYGAHRWGGTAGGAVDAVRYTASATRTEQEGFRRFARQRTTSGFATASGAVDGTTLRALWMGFDMPLAENPGAITADQMSADPRAADPQSVLKRARKTVRQQQAGITATREDAGRELFGAVYFGTRTLFNPQTFTIVDLQRRSGGASLRGTIPLTVIGSHHRVSAGADLDVLHDDRQNHDNCNAVTPGPAAASSCPVAGTERGTLRLDQLERVRALGAFARDELTLAGGWRVSVGLRSDRVTFAVDDHLITASNPDDSGNRTLHALSPIAGVVKRFGLLTAAYANASSAFETPTTTELANQPDGSAGLNRSLRPQYATTYEAGVKGVVGGRLRYDLAAYATGVRDELVPFEIPDGSGRRYYRNAGRTHRRGVELAVGATGSRLDAGATASLSDFRFARYVVGQTSYAGNRIPGAPRALGQGYITARLPRTLFFTTDVTAASRLLADDANTAHAAGYAVANVRGGGTVRVGPSAFALTVGSDNVFDRRYAPSVSINAARGKYYEPATRRTIYVGISAGASSAPRTGSVSPR